MKKKWMSGIVLLLVLSLAMVGVVGCGGSNSAEEDPTIIVGSKTFTEALLLGELTYQYLDALEYPAENQTGLGELAVVRPALESGEINCYWEYTGTVLIAVMEEEPSYDEVECYETVKEWDAENGIVWLPYAEYQSTYCLPVRQEIAAKYELETISDLVEQIKKGEKIRLAGFQEWVERDDGLKRVEEVYGFEYPKDQISLLSMFMGLDAMDQGEVDVCISNTIEPRLKSYDLFILEDDKNCFPVYNPAPLFKQEIIDAYPELTDQMQKLTDVLTEDAINDLCNRVDVDKESVEKAAGDFLAEKELI
ncbi:MAG TPA: ABC transporter substrate-binding protein [Peptococcaceae bacterium]|nr:ABC transporter substrate-binding protein [Peptococcaceae bacterium]